MRRAILALLLLGGLGCNEGLPSVFVVQDLRVLGVRAEPPEVLIENLLPENPMAPYVLPYQPVDRIRFEVLAVDPRGAVITSSWQMCPVESGQACHNYDEIMARSLNGIEAGFGPLFDELIGMGGAPAITAADVTEIIRRGMNRIRDTTGGPDVVEPAFGTDEAVVEQPIPAFEYVLLDAGAPNLETCSLLGFHGLSNQFGFLQGSWPSVIANLEVEDRSLEVQKRWVLNVGDTSAIANLLPSLLGCVTTTGASGMQINIGDIDPEAFLGFLPCPPEPLEQPEGCLQLAPRLPNSNPEFAGLLVAAGDQANAPFHPVDVTPLQLTVERSLRIRPFFTDASFETYEEIRTDLESQRLFVEQVTEEMSVSWFVTAGEVQDPLTWPKFTRTLDTVYTAPEEVPADSGGIVTIWMVGLDQRGGTDWTSVQIQICPVDGSC